MLIKFEQYTNNISDYIEQRIKDKHVQILVGECYLKVYSKGTSNSNMDGMNGLNSIHEIPVILPGSDK